MKFLATKRTKTRENVLIRITIYIVQSHVKWTTEVYTYCRHVIKTTRHRYQKFSFFSAEKKLSVIIILAHETSLDVQA